MHRSGRNGEKKNKTDNCAHGNLFFSMPFVTCCKSVSLHQASTRKLTHEKPSYGSAVRGSFLVSEIRVLCDAVSLNDRIGKETRTEATGVDV